MRRNTLRGTEATVSACRNLVHGPALQARGRRMRSGPEAPRGLQGTDQPLEQTATRVSVGVTCSLASPCCLRHPLFQHQLTVTLRLINLRPTACYHLDTSPAASVCDPRWTLLRNALWPQTGTDRNFGADANRTHRQLETGGEVP